MSVQISFKNLDKVSEVEDYINAKMHCLTLKFTSFAFDSIVDLSKTNNTYIVSCRILGRNSTVVSAKDFDMITCVDKTFDKISSVLRRKKNKMRSKHKKKNSVKKFFIQEFEQLETINEDFNFSYLESFDILKL